MQSINGIPVTLSSSCMKETEVRLFPQSKHRSKRIFKKFIKRFGGEFEKEPAMFQSPHGLIMHPIMYLKLKMEARNEKV